MPDVRAIEEAVQSLQPTDLAEFRRWFIEFDSAAWDRQVEADIASGRLNELLDEAEQDFKDPSSRAL